MGQTNMTITEADIKFKMMGWAAPESILDQFPNLVLAPNETTFVTETQMIDICVMHCQLHDGPRGRCQHSIWKGLRR
jgi:hypothetical protein